MVRKIGVTKAYPFEDYLLVGINKAWHDICGGELSFQILLDDRGHLCLISEQCLITKKNP